MKASKKTSNILILLILIISIFITYYLLKKPDNQFHNAMFHYYYVAFSAIICLIVIILAYFEFRVQNEPKIYFITLGYIGILVTYGFHGLITPGMSIFEFSTATEQINAFVFFGDFSRLWIATMLVIQGFNKSFKTRTIYNLRNLFLLTIMLIFICSLLSMNPTWLPTIKDAQGKDTYFAILIKVITLIFLGVSLTRYFDSYRIVPNAPLLTFMASIFLMMETVIIFLISKPFGLVWWFAHNLYMISFLFVGIGLWISRRSIERLQFFDVSSQIENYVVRLKQSSDEMAILNKDLEISRERAYDANIAKGMFLANMSHEIRTPMNGIIGFLQLLKNTEVNETQSDYVREAICSSEVLLCIINDILDLSKIEAGKLSMEKIKFNIRSTVKDAVSSFKPKVDEKGLLLYSSIKSNVPEEIMGDPARLRQILNNLLSNAIKFTAVGEVAVNLEVIEETDNIVTLRFEVKDTGLGINKEVISKLFKPFTQATISTTREFGGTGLGLAISKELASMMEGDIGVESIEGNGSTFFFTAKFEIINKTKEGISTNLGKLKNMKVLIVDDNKRSQNIIRSYLEDFGVQVVEALSGERAITELLIQGSSENPIDVVISDYQMKGMSPYELSSTIRGFTSIRNTRLILLIDLAQKEDDLKAKKFGFDAYLTKPIKRDELLDLVITVTSLEKKASNNNVIITKDTQKELQKNNTPRILLAEDNIINQKVVVAMLQNRGLTCDIAKDGDEAYKACLSKKYDIVFMDCQMPVMDGYEATLKIRRAEIGRGRTKIIAMTANAMEGDREKCIESGMDDYISKPIDFELMYKMIEISTYREAEGKRNFDFMERSLVKFVSHTGITMDYAKELFSDYLDSIPHMLKSIEDAMESEDLETLHRYAHQLRGSSGNLRINEIYELSTRLEQSALDNDKGNCEKELSDIKKLFE
jgi:two-component system sensor histidine kinase/response regulator